MIAEEAMEDEIAEDSETRADDLLDEVDVAATDDNVSDEDVTDEAELSDGETETGDDVNEDLIGQLDSLIKRSQENRDLWEKFHALPP